MSITGRIIRAHVEGRGTRSAVDIARSVGTSPVSVHAALRRHGMRTASAQLKAVKRELRNLIDYNRSVYANGRAASPSAALAAYDALINRIEDVL